VPRDDVIGSLGQRFVYAMPGRKLMHRSSTQRTGRRECTSD